MRASADGSVVSGAESQPVEVPVGRTHDPHDGIVLTHFIVSDNVERSRRFGTVA
jgi:hypothetical protein